MQQIILTLCICQNSLFSDLKNEVLLVTTFKNRFQSNTFKIFRTALPQFRDAHHICTRKVGSLQNNLVKKYTEPCLGFI